MKNIEISDELYEKLKDFVADPFDDTPEIVIRRAVEVATKAKSRWSPLDICASNEQADDYSFASAEQTQNFEDEVPEPVL